MAPHIWTQMPRIQWVLTKNENKMCVLWPMFTAFLIHLNQHYIHYILTKRSKYKKWWTYNCLPFHWGSSIWNLIELVLVLPLQVNTTYGSENPVESTAAKFVPSIKATVTNHPSPCALTPWSLPRNSYR